MAAPKWRSISCWWETNIKQMHIKIRFADNSPPCASLSQTQMHWEILCRGICMAVDEVAKFDFASVQGSRTKEGWAERGISMILYGITLLIWVTLQGRQPSVHLPWWQSCSGRCYFSGLGSKSCIGAKWSKLPWKRAVPHLFLALPRGPGACFALVYSGLAASVWISALVWSLKWKRSDSPVD